MGREQRDDSGRHDLFGEWIPRAPVHSRADDAAMKWVVAGPPASAALELANRPQVLSWDSADWWAQRRLVPCRAEIAERFPDRGTDGWSFDLACGPRVYRRHNQLSTYEYRSISGVQMETGPITGKLFLQVPGESSTDVSKAPNGIKIANNHYARAREGVALLRQYVAEAHAATAAPAPAPTPAPDIADQLRKLGELRDAGVLTDEEFLAKKADLLARM